MGYDNKKVTVLNHTCHSTHQDRLFGKGKRLFQGSKKDGKCYTCTSCRMENPGYTNVYVKTEE